MAKVSYTNLKLKINKEIKEISFNDTKIEVLQYLPIEDKYDLVMITLQKAEKKILSADMTDSEGRAARP